MCSFTLQAESPSEQLHGRYQAWMHWPMDGLVAWTLSWFGHGWQAKVGAMQT